MTDGPGRHPFLAGRAPLAFAHRGGTESAPENSVAAFAGAVGLGFTHLETDVHLSADGVVIALHDEQLDRVADRPGVVAEMSAAEIRSARLGGTEPVPTLEELLDAFPEARFNIDAKSDAVVEPLVELLRRGDHVERVCVAAFSDTRIRRLRELLPGACTTAGPREVAALVGASTVRPRRGGVARAPYHCLQVPLRHRGLPIVSRRFVDAAHRRGAQVHVWTVDEPAEMHRLLDLGVDGIMTDRPSVLRDVLVRRGVWEG